MKLVADQVCEFRRVVSRPANNGNGINYYYHFEDDDNGAFQLWSRKDFPNLQKGDLVTLVFKTRLWDNKLQFDLDEVVKV